MSEQCLIFGQLSKHIYHDAETTYALVSLLFIIFSVNMNSNHNLEIKQIEKGLEQQTIQHKKFIQNAFHIDYTNSSKIYCETSQKNHDVKVNNYLCYQQGQILYKITEILYEDKIIRIEDKFEVSPDPELFTAGATTVEEKNIGKDKKCSRNIQKVRIFCKDAVKSSGVQKRDKKNIVKNIVKIFVSWLQKKTNETSVSSASQQLNKLLKTENFNNRLIKKMTMNKQISKQFLTFLEDDAEQEIRYSRIKDKQSHYQVLQIYKNLLKNPGPSAEISSSQVFNSQDQDQNSGLSSDFSMKKSVNSKQNINGDHASRQKSHEALIKQRAQTTDSSRRNKLILVQNGSQSSSK